MAAGGGDDDGGFGGDAFVERVVGGGVAGVKGDEDVDVLGIEIGDVTPDEFEATVAAGGGDVVAEIDEVGAGFDAGD